MVFDFFFSSSKCFSTTSMFCCSISCLFHQNQFQSGNFGIISDLNKMVSDKGKHDRELAASVMLGSETLCF